MRLRRVLTAALLAAFAPAFGAGCGGGDPTGAVSGEVTYNGTPVESGTIQFTPKDGKGAAVGGPVTAGKFDVKNVPVGVMLVSINASAGGSGSPVSSEDSAREAAERLAAKKKFVDKAPSIPPGAGGNNEPFEVKAGSNTLKVQLTPPRTR